MKSNPRYILLVSACLIGFCTLAQTSLSQLTLLKDNVQGKRGSESNSQVTPARSNAPDTVYCYGTTKRYGWFEPLGLLTKEQTRHRERSYRFTGKNAKGHWTKMESINAYGNYTPSGSSPYIAKIGSEKDTLVNKNWAEILKGSCIFEFIPDPSGDIIIQERAYDKDFNLLYSYSRVPIGSNQFIGSYRDINGLPAEMRENPNYKYGTLVLITQDDRGFDAQIEYIDSQRRHKLNSDGAFAERYSYNDAGDLTMQCSIDSLGNPTDDDWGNCAAIYDYDIKDLHLITSSYYADSRMQPVRMPAVEAGQSSGTIKHLYEYDEFFRQKKVTFVSESGEKDTNRYGCHIIEFEYDDFGNTISMVGYDKNGRPAPADASGTADYKFKYDTFGNMVTAVFTDKDGLPVSTPGYLSRIVSAYTPDGQQISLKQYVYQDGAERLSYSEETTCYDDHKEIRYQWYDGSYKIVKYDPQERIIFEGYYSTDGNPLNSDGTWSHVTKEYTDLGDRKTHVTELYYDTDGELTKSNLIFYSRREAFCDSVTGQETYMDYLNGRLVQSYSKTFGKDYGSPIGQSDRNRFGVISRSGGISGVRHYSAKVKRSHLSNISHIQGIDEFGEPDYIVDSDGLVYYYSRNTLGGTSYMTTENRAIRDGDKKMTRNRLPKVMSIEVVDSVAYAAGLRDNDVILKYGDYIVDLNYPESDRQFKADWTVHSVLNANTPKDMLVFRIEDVKAGKFGLVTIPNLQGTPTELGFIPHVRYLTERQTERILGCLEDISYIIPEYKLKENYVIIDFPEMFRSQRDTPYATAITDATVFLGAYDSTRDLKYDFRDEDQTDNLNKMLNPAWNIASNDSVRVEYYFSNKDGKIVTLTSIKEGLGLALSDAQISEHDFFGLLPMYQTVAGLIDSRRATVKHFKPKDLQGIWVVADDDNTNSFSGYIQIDKDGKCSGELTAYYLVDGSTIPEGMSPIFRIERQFGGTWHDVDSLLIITPETEIKNNVRCVAIQEDIHNTADNWTYFDKDYRTYTNYYNKRLKPLFGFNDAMFIKSLDKKSMVVEDGCGNRVVLIKSKKRPVQTVSEPTPTPLIANDVLGTWLIEEENITGILSFFDNNYARMDVNVFMPKTDFNGEYAVAARISIPASWRISDDKINISFNTSTTDLDCNLVNFSLDAQERETTLNAMYQSLKAELPELLEAFKSEGERTATISADNLLHLDDEAKGMQHLPLHKSLVIGNIEGEEGYLVEAGYTGTFIILQYCDWTCESDIDAFKDVFEQQADNSKHLIMLPISSDENGNDVFGQPITIDCAPGLMGMRIYDHVVNGEYYINRVRPWFLMMTK